MFYFIGTDDFKKSALISKLVSLWYEKTRNHMGRTTIQKLCYFSESIGVPLSYKFSVYKYGPYSQELFEQIDDMVIYGFLIDKHSESDHQDKISLYSITELAEELLTSYNDFLTTYEERLCLLVEYFKDMTLRELELLSTMHYYYTANNGYYRGVDKEEIKKLTIDRVIKAKKDEFEKNEIDNAYYKIVETAPAFC